MRVIAAIIAGAAVALAPSSSRADEDDYIREAVRLDTRFDKVVEGGCRYMLAISGTITPLPGQQNEKAPQVAPNVAVWAQASCPNEQSVKVGENILGTGPLTWRQLEDSLAQRARVVTGSNHHECTYAPSFRVVGSHIDVSNFDYHCRAI